MEGTFATSGLPRGTARTSAPLRVQTAEAEAGQRADAYGLLALLLAEPPAETLLGRLAAIADDVADESPIGSAWRRLGRAARHINTEDASEEYHALFIGLTEGEVMPYASWYETGFLMDRPLVRLRSDLARLGFARQEGVREPEDHAAALCEVMGLLVEEAGGTGGDATLRDFFEAHVAPWMPAFFADLRRAPSAVLYAAVADLGVELLDLERRYLSLLQESTQPRAWPTVRPADRTGR